MKDTSNQGKLYIVPTPVGNLGDMTPRAVEVLGDVSLILAEDTRTSAPLLAHFGISTPCVSHHKYNEHDTVRPIVDRIAGGESVALISDAGTPGISDPGFCSHANVGVLILKWKLCRERRPLSLHWLIPDCHATGFALRAFCPLKKAGVRVLRRWLPMIVRLYCMNHHCGLSKRSNSS